MNEKRFFSGINASQAQAGNQVNNIVYVTSDYSIFNLSKFNRNILLRNEMIKQAEEGFVAPIIVNENYTVIDGQHRLEASKKVGVPVEFIVKPGLGDHDIVRMNTVQKPWSLQNYIESYANQGKTEYMKLVGLIKEKYSNVTVISNIAVDSPTNANVAKKVIKNGTFKFYNFEKTVEFLQYYKRFREETKTKKRTTVATALYELFKIKGFDRNRIIDKTIATGLSEDINVKTFMHTDILKTFIEAYNHKLSPTMSAKYIKFHITSFGTLVIDEEKEDWAIKKPDAPTSDQTQ